MRAHASNFLILALLPACGSKPPAAPAPQGSASGAAAVPVSTALASRADVPKEILAVGIVDPIASVSLKPQVAGMLLEVSFEEGSDVRAGDLLLKLDARPFEAAVQVAEADLARDRALAQDARAAAEQIQGAQEKSAVSKRSAEQALAGAAAAEATVAKDTATLESARLDLEYCSIRAPFDGRTGKLQAPRGTVVKANETVLVDLHQIVPIRVEFSVPEGDLSQIRAASAKGPLRVVAVPPGASPVEGKLSFLDNQVDRTTGTIRLLATFPNEDRSLWPGQFVQVQLRVDVEAGVVLVPSRAVQSGQDGDYVFVVGGDGKVAVRKVRVARTTGESSVVAEGLEGSETVVTEGQLRLVPGTRVESKPAPPESASR